MGKKSVRASEKKPRRVRHDHTSAWRRVVGLPVLALLLALIVEFLNRTMSFPRLWQFLTGKPLAFLYGALIILATLSFSELFKRRRAVLVTLTITWLALGIVQYIVIKERTQPFCSVEIGRAHV